MNRTPPRNEPASVSTTTQGTNKIPATLIPGDGIGPEIVDAVHPGAERPRRPVRPGPATGRARGDRVRRRSAASGHARRRNKIALKGPLTTPVGGGFRSVNVRLREEFQLYANLRPAHTLVPGGRFENIDLILVRENLEGLYVAFEHYIPIGDDPHAVAISSGVNTRDGSRRIVRYAFEHAVKLGRKKVTLVHKANVLKALTGVFLEAGQQIGREYAGRIECDERIVDACAMQLVLNPWQFDVIVTTNLFGDILSDLIAGLVGGLGAAPGTNIGEKAAIFEAVHGSAPDIAGKGLANPTALLLAAGLMLDHVGLVDHTRHLRKSIDQVLNEDKVRTGDLGRQGFHRRFCQGAGAADRSGRLIPAGRDIDPSATPFHSSYRRRSVSTPLTIHKKGVDADRRRHDEIVSSARRFQRGLSKPRTGRHAGGDRRRRPPAGHRAAPARPRRARQPPRSGQRRGSLPDGVR